MAHRPVTVYLEPESKTSSDFSVLFSPVNKELCVYSFLNNL